MTAVRFHIALFLLVCLLITSQAQIFIGGIQDDEPSQIQSGTTIDFAVKCAVGYLQSTGYPKSMSSLCLQDDGNATVSAQIALSFIVNSHAQGLIGTHSSGSSTVVSLNVLNKYKKPMISYSASSVLLSDKTLHPYFLRTMPPDSKQADTITDLLYMFELNVFSTINSQEPYGSAGVDQVARISVSKGLKLLTRASYVVGDPISIALAITALKNSGAKVFNAWITSTDVEAVIFEAINQGIMAPNYLWVFSETLGDILGINSDQSVSFFNPLIQPWSNGMIYVDFAEAYWDKSQYMWTQFQKNTTSKIVTTQNKFAYDALLAYGYALQNMNNISDGDLLVSNLKQLSFMGASGLVEFDSNGDRIGATYQMYSILNGKVVPVLIWNDINGVQIVTRTIYTRDLTSYNCSLNSSLSNQKEWNSIPFTSNPPSQRYSATMIVYLDSFYVFGGKNASVEYNDLYQFNVKTNTWNNLFYISSIVPISRYLHGMWQLNGKLYIYGGASDKQFFDDHWEFDLQAFIWRQIVSNVSPGVRYDFSVATVNNVVYLYGGYGSNGIQNDVWFWNGKWNQMNVSNSIEPRVGGCMAALDSRIYVFGGRNGLVLYSDLQFIDTVNMQWKKLRSISSFPPARSESTCFFINSIFYLGFGQGNETFGDFWMGVVNGSDVVWTQLSSSPIPRSASSFATFEQNAVIFGGISDGMSYNDLLRFNTRNNVFQQIHTNVVTPPPLSGHRTTLIANQMFLFGGRLPSNLFSHDLWALDLNSETWSNVQPLNSPPPEREHHSMSSTIDIFFIFGGIGAQGYLDDFYKYSYFLNSWIEIQTGLNGPGSRAGHCSVMNSDGSKLYLYGGRNSVDFLNELWEYDLTYSTWTQRVVSGGSADHLYLIQCLLYQNTLVVYGGENSILDGMQSMIFLDLDTGNVTSVSVPISITETCMKSISNDGAILLYGGGRKQDVFGNLHQIHIALNPVSVNVTDITPQVVPSARKLHTCEFYGDSIVAFGGLGSIPGKSTFLKSVQFNQIWKYKIGDICLNTTHTDCRKCSPGTCTHKGQCLSCPTGTWSDKFGADQCTPCPIGFIGVLLGASSKSLCSPCPFGSYNPIAGASSCIPCGVNQTCPIGSFLPSYSKIGFSESLIAIQPIPIDPGDALESVIITASYISLFTSFGVIFTIGVACWWKCSAYYEKADILFRRSHFPPAKSKDKVIVYRKTPFGGIYTIGLVAAAICMLIATLLPTILQNNREIRTMIPNAVIAPNVLYSTKLTASVRALDYPGACNTNCSSGLGVFPLDLIIHPSAITTTQCFQEVIGNSSTCTIQWSCSNCTMKSTASLNFVFTDPGSLASGISYNISTSAAYPDSSGYGLQNSQVQSTMLSDPSTFLRGIINPTTTSILVIQTSYYFENNDYYQYGYMLNSLTQSLGDQVDSKNFSQFNGISFSFSFSFSENSIEVTRVKKKSEVSVIAELLGSLSGLIGIMVLLIGKTEQIMIKIKFYLGVLQNRLIKYDPDISDYEVANAQRPPELIQMNDDVDIIQYGKLTVNTKKSVTPKMQPIIERAPKTLYVRVLNAKSIPKMDRNGFADPFVVVKLDRVVRKTSIVKKSLNPVWDELLTFDLSEYFFEKYILSRICIEIWDWDGFLKNPDFIGSFYINFKDLSVDEETDAVYRIPCYDNATQTIHFASIHLNIKFA